MTAHRGTESDFELTVIERLEALGYRHVQGQHLDRPLDEVVLRDRLRAFLAKRYPDLPAASVGEAVGRLASLRAPTRFDAIWPSTARSRAASRCASSGRMGRSSTGISTPLIGNDPRKTSSWSSTCQRNACCRTRGISSCSKWSTSRSPRRARSTTSSSPFAWRWRRRSRPAASTPTGASASSGTRRVPASPFPWRSWWESSGAGNIIVIADEAHRSQYGFLKGYARYLGEALPNARRIGFTGTPISFGGADTVEVFGDLIHTYDIQQSQEDRATVPIHYEPRQVRLHLAQHDVDAALEEILRGGDVGARDRGRWAALAAAAGARDRLDQLAKDLLAHFQQRTATLEGKALVVCMTRENCVRLYGALKALPGCPEVKIVMTGGHRL